MYNVFVYGLLRGDILSPLSHVMQLYSWEYATLPNHVVGRAYGHYTVIPSNNSSAFGILYFGVDDKMMAELDLIEGVGVFYERKIGDCYTRKWEDIGLPCVYYQMEDRHLNVPLKSM